jgi:hypothetical protein
MSPAIKGLVPPTLVFLAALWVLFGTLHFGSQRPGYSQTANTISELGEAGSPISRDVSFGFFLPVGLLIWLALWLVHGKNREKHISSAMLALSCMGTGYALSAFVPCDPGLPLLGSWREQVHEFLGLVMYAGTGLGFILAARHFTGRKEFFPAALFFGTGILVLLGLVLLSWGVLARDSVFHVRGAIQRVTEAVAFVSLTVVCYKLTAIQRTSI